MQQHTVVRFENHWLACMASAGGGGRVVRVPGGMVVVNPRVSGMAFNFLTLRDARPEQLDLTLQAGRALLGELQRPPALFLSPAAGDVAALSAGLKARGWTRRLEQVVLARPLDVVPEPQAAEVRVREIGGSELITWGEVLIQGYEAPADVGDEIRQAWMSLYQAPGQGAHARFYLAWMDGKPVGTGLSWVRGEIAGLYCGAVLPAYRRRGVERATLARRMTDARGAGAAVAILQTETGSPVEHLCTERLGFHRAYERSLWVSC